MAHATTALTGQNVKVAEAVLTATTEENAATAAGANDQIATTGAAAVNAAAHENVQIATTGAAEANAAAVTNDQIATTKDRTPADVHRDAALVRTTGIRRVTTTTTTSVEESRAASRVRRVRVAAAMTAKVAKPNAKNPQLAGEAQPSARIAATRVAMPTRLQPRTRANVASHLLAERRCLVGG